MKVTLTKQTSSWYTATQEINIDVPDGTEDVKAFVETFLDDGEAEEEFSDADTEDQFSDPDEQWYTITDDNGKVDTWQNY